MEYWGACCLQDARQAQKDLDVRVRRGAGCLHGMLSYGDPETLIGRYPIIVGSDISAGCGHELIPPAPFSWEEKGAEKNTSHASLQYTS